ncbi:histidine phosphatase family protein [Mesorhizobium sp. CGMCC 1.15528]|uniref:Histidine phosphatase family protein n=1 Tax=Mesorhizobium zhangyense TaxID=1776730 RepID=A0A7C9VFS2_9HYPH|nr:histidine phosphatase family protein [Mesorhizobium zhangyense]NGN43308.1 histidine phosphatase family protein [Mesorhizobium zhangyense]
MKELLLLRHAKSSWDDPELADFDRPLAPRGLDAAPVIGQAIASRGWFPQMALVSPSLRTRETWQIVAAQSPRFVEPTFCSALYEASAGQLLAEVRHAPEEITSLLLLGHNPGMQDFATLIASEDSDETALQLLRKKFSTAGLARLEFDGRWDELRAGAARLSHFLRPKDFG